MNEREFTFAGRPLLELEAERAAKEDALERLRKSHPDSVAIPIMENYLGELIAAIARKKLGK